MRKTKSVGARTRQTKAAEAEFTSPANNSISFHSEDRPSFIVQNIGAGFCCITDIGLEFAPGEAIDLTWWDIAKVKRSTDLRRAIVSGYLVQISANEHDDLLVEEVRMSQAEERSAASKEARRRRKFQVEGAEHTEVEAEVINLNKAESRGKSATITSYGLDNDPKSYAKAFEIAQADAKAAGARLTARSFKTMVTAYAKEHPTKPGLVHELLEKDQSSWSGDPNRGRATVRLASSHNGGPDVGTFGMTNYNRDQTVAGAHEAGMVSYKNRDDLYTDEYDYEIDLDEVGVADSIDLAMDDDDESEEIFEENERAKVRRVAR